MANLLSGDIGNIANILAAAGALGTAAFGLVDVSKVCRGGVSNVGFGHLKTTLEPFHAAFKKISKAKPMETIKANWLNGVPKADQKAVAKSLIHLGLAPSNANQLAAVVGIDAAALSATAKKIDSGAPMLPDDINILSRFDALVGVILDAGYERADQLYRNSAKAAAALVAVVLAVVAGAAVFAQGKTFNFIDYVTSQDLVQSLIIGIISTPLAPIAKDLSTSLAAAVKAVSAART